MLPDGLHDDSFHVSADWRRDHPHTQWDVGMGEPLWDRPDFTCTNGFCGIMVPASIAMEARLAEEATFTGRFFRLPAGCPHVMLPSV